MYAMPNGAYRLRACYVKSYILTSHQKSGEIMASRRACAAKRGLLRRELFWWWPRGIVERSNIIENQSKAAAFARHLSSCAGIMRRGYRMCAKQLTGAHRQRRHRAHVSVGGRGGTVSYSLQYLIWRRQRKSAVYNNESLNNAKHHRKFNGAAPHSKRRRVAIKRP